MSSSNENNMATLNENNNKISDEFSEVKLELKETEEERKDKEKDEKPRRSSLFNIDFSKRRSSNVSNKSFSSSRRGSKIDSSSDDDEEDGLPKLPNISYRKGSISQVFPITDDLPCMKSKRNSVSSISSQKSEDIPHIAFRKSSLSIVYTVPDLLSLESSIREELREDSSENGDRDKDEFHEIDIKTEAIKEYATSPIDVDHIIKETGDFGKYQLLLILCSIPFMFSYLFSKNSHVFLTLLPNQYWCNVPELSSLSQEQIQNLAIPKMPNNQFDQCQMYDVNYTELVANNELIPNLTWSRVPCKNGWSYDTSEVTYNSIAMENNWICDQHSYVLYAQLVRFIGSIMGTLIFGSVADHFGRKPALLISNFVGLLGALLTAFSDGAPDYHIFRFISGIAYDGSFIFFYILLIENVSSKWRTLAGTLPFLVPYTIAEVSLPWIAYLLSDWKWMAVVTGIPFVIGLIVGLVIPESPRWLLATGKIEKGICVFKKIDKINKAKVDPKYFNRVKEFYSKKQGTECSQCLFGLFSTPNYKKNVAIFILLWVGTTMVLYSIMLKHSFFGLSQFSTSSLFGVLVLPACVMILVLIESFERRRIMGFGLITGSLCLIISAIILSNVMFASILGAFSKILVKVTHIVAIQYSIELFPTSVRGRGVSLIHAIGAIFAIVFLYLIQLDQLDAGLPYILIGLIGLIGGVVSLLLPETLHEPLPEVVSKISDMFHYAIRGKDNKSFST